LATETPMPDRTEPRSCDRGVIERPKGSGIWWAIWYDEHNHKRRKKCGSNRLAVQFRAKKLNEVFERQNFPERFRNKDTLLADAIDDYIARRQGMLRSLVNWKRYARQWKKALGAKTLRQILPGDVERFAARRRAAGLCDASVNRELTFLRTVINMAIEDGKAISNPVRPSSSRRRTTPGFATSPLRKKRSSVQKLPTSTGRPSHLRCTRAFARGTCSSSAGRT
jgi:hypothetical protein